jgi:hypothetical protein
MNDNGILGTQLFHNSVKKGKNVLGLSLSVTTMSQRPFRRISKQTLSLPQLYSRLRALRGRSPQAIHV